MKVVTLRRPAARTELRGATMPRVNLLPPEVVEIRRFRRVQYGLGGAVLAAIGVVILLLVLALGAVASAQRKVDAARDEHSQLQGRVAKLNGVKQVYTQVAASEAQVRSAVGTEVQFSHYLNDLSLTIPPNVWLTNFSVTLAGAAGTAPAAGSNPIATPGIGTVTANGTAFSHNDVADWLDSLGRQKGYADPYFSSSTASSLGGRQTVNFASTATITAAALSHRFDRVPGG